MKKFLLLFSICLTYSNLFSQNNIADHWFDADESAIEIPIDEERTITPTAYRTLALDLEGLKASLANAPMELTAAAEQNPRIIALPLPNGEEGIFEVYESPVMAPELAAKFPEIKSFAGHGMDDPSMRVRFDYSANGFRAMIETKEGIVFIDPYLKGNNLNYVAYLKDDLVPTAEQVALLEKGDYNSHSPLEHLDWMKPTTGGPNSPFEEKGPTPTPTPSNTPNTTEGAPVELLVYRLALSTTGEYAQQVPGGTLSDVTAELAFALGRVNFIFEKETGIRFQLIPNNDEIIFLDPDTDPFDIDIPNATTGQYMSQNRTNLNTAIGVENYDIGHVFAPYPCESTGNIAGTSGGIGIVCGDNKALGVSCSNNPSESFYLGVLCHEIGHQLGAPHPWANCNEELNQSQMSPGAAYSPGSGNTIMSYAGSCGANNIQFGSDFYLHVNSVETIYNYTRDGGGACATVLPTNNTSPDIFVPLGDGLRIPISTPFQLTGVATDADANDTLTYCWEQYNLGPTAPLGNPTGNGPSFRSYSPTENPTRVFPRIETIISNSSTVVEVLPTYNRDLTFRCTARDSKWGGGGTVWEEISFDATTTAGPFLVTYPNDFLAMKVGDYVDVEWDVANTDNATVNCQRINILLSLDGGYTYPITLAENVENDGGYRVLIPDAETNIARIKVEAADNIFFDLSNSNSRISPATDPGFAFAAGPAFQRVCLPELPVFEINTLSLLNYDSLVTLEVLGLPAGATGTFSESTVSPSEGSTLTISTDNTPLSDGIFTFQVRAIAGGDTITQELSYETQATNFSDLVAATPENAMIAVSELPTFTWMEANAADDYQLEVASNPSFDATALVESTIVTGNTYTSNVQLELGAVYFWRIRAQNECADGEWSEAKAFAVKSLSCIDAVSTNDPITISGNGLPTISSTISFPSDGTISDINITNILGNHAAFKDIEMRLIGPDATSVELFSSVICFASEFNFGVDDEAPGNIGSDCPVNTGIAYKPQNLLEAFDGKNALGDWMLEVEVINTAGSGGRLDSWSVEICSEANLSPPSLIKNNEMPLPPGFSRDINNEFLLTTDPNNGADELIYTIVTLPANGQLFLLGTELTVGARFSQNDVNAGDFKYTHDGTSSTVVTMDSFTFTVEDGEGGLIATPQFDLLIDPDVVISTNDLLKPSEISIFPNPANELINIGFTKPLDEQVNVRVFNLQGQLLVEKLAKNTQDLIQIETKHLAAGLYLVQVLTENESLTERVTIHR